MEKTNYCYIKSEPQLWTVGFYSPNGEWHPDSDHSDREDAAKRVAFLNGGSKPIITVEGTMEAIKNITISRSYLTGWQLYEVDLVKCLTELFNPQPNKGR